MAKKKALNGAESFEAHYQEVFGDRWGTLKAALELPVRQEPLPGPSGTSYWLDAGSFEAANALPLADEGRFLDMCAAPGGKSLAIARKMSPESTLVSNELSSDRKSRLIRVLDEFLEPHIRSRVTVTGRDAAKWSKYETSAYDGILLDVPCSSERHVLSSPPHLAAWSPARIKNLAYRQWALLSGAWLVLKPGGYLVYSTCALSPAENDDVVQKLFQKYDDAIRIESESLGERTQWGVHILPDAAEGAGPIYYAILGKAEKS